MKIKFDNLKNTIHTRIFSDRINMVYISLLLLCLALLLYSSHLFYSYEDLNKPLHSALVKQGDEYLLRFNLVNNEDIDCNYRLSILLDGKRYDESVILGPERIYVYQHRIYPPLHDGRINVSVFREGELVSETMYLLD